MRGQATDVRYARLPETARVIYIRRHSANARASVRRSQVRTAGSLNGTGLNLQGRAVCGPLPVLSMSARLPAGGLLVHGVADAGAGRGRQPFLSYDNLNTDKPQVTLRPLSRRVTREQWTAPACVWPVWDGVVLFELEWLGPSGSPAAPIEGLSRSYAARRKVYGCLLERVAVGCGFVERCITRNTQWSEEIGYGVSFFSEEQDTRGLASRTDGALVKL